MVNKVSVLIDVATDKAVGGLKGFKASIQDADGAMGKMKAGATSAFDSIKANAGTMALAAGAALVGFGTKAVLAFQDTALSAGQLRDALGLSAEEASRLAEVAGDVGIDVGTLESTIGRMNRAAEDTPGAFDAIGAAIVRNKDGTVNVNDTFLSTVDALNKIPDATVRASAAQDIFGRSWQDIAELVGMGADDIRVALAEVSDAKIIDEAEIQKARDTRAALDKLKDSVEDVALELGESLTPAVATAAEVLAGIAPVAGRMAGFVGDQFVAIADSAYAMGQTIADVVDALPFVNLAEATGPTLYEWQKLERGTADLVAEFAKGAPTMDEFQAAMKAAGVSQEAQNLATIEYRKQLDGTNTVISSSIGFTDELAASTEGSTLAHWDATEAAAALEEADKAAAEEQKRAKDAADDYNRVLQDQRDATNEAAAAKTALVGGDIAVREAQRAAAEAVGALNVLTKEGKADTEEFAVAQDEAATAMLGAAQAAADEQVKMAEANGAVVSAKDANQILKEKLMELASTLAPGSPLLLQIQGYIDALNRIPTEVDTRIRATGGGTIGLLPQIGGPHAAGGPVSAGVSYPVGERGVELFTPGASGFITPNHLLSNLSSAGNSYGGATTAVFNVSVQAGMGADGREIGDVILDTLAATVRRNGPGVLVKLTGG